jgi:hypothetical protein
VESISHPVRHRQYLFTLPRLLRAGRHEKGPIRKGR